MVSDRVDSKVDAVAFSQSLYCLVLTLSYDVASGSEIKPCIKIDLQIFRNIMTCITMLHT